MLIANRAAHFFGVRFLDDWIASYSDYVEYDQNREWDGEIANLRGERMTRKKVESTGEGKMTGAEARVKGKQIARKWK